MNDLDLALASLADWDRQCREAHADFMESIAQSRADFDAAIEEFLS